MYNDYILKCYSNLYHICSPIIQVLRLLHVNRKHFLSDPFLNPKHKFTIKINNNNLLSQAISFLTTL